MDASPVTTLDRVPGPERLLSWILMVGLAVRLVPLSFRAFDQSVASPLNETAGSWPVVVWTAVLWCGLTAALVLSVLAVARRVPLTWAAWVFVVTTVLAVIALPWCTSAPYPPQVRPWQLSLPITAAATTVLLFRSGGWCAVAFTVVVAPMLGVEAFAGWDAPRAVLIGDGLLALALYSAWFATTRAFAATHASLERARREATREFTRAREAEAHTRSAALRDAFLHDEVIATLALIATGSDHTLVKDAAQTLATTLHTSPSLASPQPTLMAALLDACMTRCPQAETHWHVTDDAIELPDEVVNALTDATSEALRNAVRHAYPDRRPGDGPVDVELIHDRHHVRITISDLGQGFDPTLVPEFSLGLVLAIDGRMTAVDGLASIDSAPGQGTRVTLRWPAQ